MDTASRSETAERPSAASMARLIPAIGALQSEDLQRSVAATWAASMAASPFERLDQVPQSPLFPQRSLLEHVNEVNELAVHSIEMAKRRFALDVDEDLALATAILHDVDKPLIFRFDGSVFSAAPGTDLTDHGATGAALALRHGVPASVAALVRVHSPFASTGMPGTIEGTIVHYADFVANDLASLQQGAEPIHSTYKLGARRIPLP